MAAKKSTKKKAVHAKTMSAMLRKGVSKKAATAMARRAAGKC